MNLLWPLPGEPLFDLIYLLGWLVILGVFVVIPLGMAVEPLLDRIVERRLARHEAREAQP